MARHPLLPSSFFCIFLFFLFCFSTCRALQVTVRNEPGVFYGLVLDGCANHTAATVLGANRTALGAQLAQAIVPADPAAGNVSALQDGLAQLLAALPERWSVPVNDTTGQAVVPACAPGPVDGAGACLQLDVEYTLDCGADSIVAALPAPDALAVRRVVTFPWSSTEIFVGWQAPPAEAQSVVVAVLAAAQPGSAYRWGSGHQFLDYPQPVARHVLSASQTSLVVGHLTPYSIYRLEVTAESALVAGRPRIAFTATQAAAPAPLAQRPELLDASSRGATLHWTEAPDAPRGRVVDVLLQWRLTEQPSSWTTERFSNSSDQVLWLADQGVMVLHTGDLWQPQSAVQVRVARATLAGASAYSPVLDLVTASELELPPMDLQAAPNGSLVDFTWQLAQPAHGTMVRVELVLSNAVLAYCAGPCTSLSVPLSSLPTDPSSQALRVRVVNDAGTGHASSRARWPSELQPSPPDSGAAHSQSSNQVDAGVVYALGAVVAILLLALVLLVAVPWCRAHQRRHSVDLMLPAAASKPGKHLNSRKQAQQPAFALPPEDPLWQYQRSQLIKRQTLGTGAFGIVFEGVLRVQTSTTPANTTVAVKSLRPDVDPKYKDRFILEMNLMKRIR